MSYVVTVKPPDDYPGAMHVFGPWVKRSLAVAFAAKVNAEVETLDSHVDDSTGWAYVQYVRPKRLRDARAWAVRGELGENAPQAV